MLYSWTVGKHRTLQPLMLPWLLWTKVRLRSSVMGVDMEAFRVTLGRGGLSAPMEKPETILMGVMMMRVSSQTQLVFSGTVNGHCAMVQIVNELDVQLGIVPKAALKK
jgi:hypothetical protein